MFHKRKFPYVLFAILLIVLLCAGYLISGLFVLPEGMKITSEETTIYLITHLTEIYNEKTKATMGVAILVWLYAICWYLYYFRNFHENPHGSAGWRDVHEACKVYIDKEPKNNRILTQNLQVSMNGPLPNNNMLIIASSGDGKTTSVVEPNLLQMISSYIMLDVKGDTQRKLGNAFKKAGYNVRSLNFKQPEKSDRYNPFVYIETENDLLRTIKALHDACRPPQNNSTAEPFWDDAVNLYLQAMFYAVWLEGRRNGRHGTMNDVLRLANMEAKKVQIIMPDESVRESTELQMYMDELADEFGEDYAPVRDYRKLKDGASDTVNTVILMVNSMLSICETAEVRRIFSGNDINIRDIGSGVGGDPNKKTILFLVIPDNNNVYNWIISMFYNQALDILIRHADDEINGPLPIRVEFWMDEFYAGARPDNTVQLLGVVRSRNICLIPILQSRSQLKDLFKEDKAEIVMDNVSVVLFLGSGPTALDTHKWISELLDQMTIDTKHDNASFGSNAHSTLDFNKQGRSLMTPSEVKELPLTEAIMFLKASKPMHDTKAFPFDREDLNYIAPKWLKERYDKMLSYGKYEHPVHTIYDPVHFRYITVEPDMPYQIITDKKEIETYQEAAKNDPSIYTYTIDESQLLYLSWGKDKCNQEYIEDAYKEIKKEVKARKEAMKGLIVLQNRDDIDEVLNQETLIHTDKTGWEKYSSLQTLIKAKWNELAAPEQEEVSLAFAADLSEEQIRMVMLQEYAKMAVLRQVFEKENREVG